MPAFRDAAVSQAPPEEVWKLLYDPARYPEWWAGITAVEEREPEEGEPRRFTYRPEGAPDELRPQLLETRDDHRGIVISCLVFDVRFEWTLEPAGDGDATRIGVLVDIPEAEAAHLDATREGIARSVRRLADLAART